MHPIPCDAQAAGSDPHRLALTTPVPPRTCPTSKSIHRLAFPASARISVASILVTVGGGGERTCIMLDGVEEGL